MRVFVQVVLTAVLATIAAGFLALAGSAVAQTPVSVSAPTPIAAYGGRLVWSRPDGAGGFELVQRVGDGPVTRLPIPSRSVPFDVDLGPTSGGRVLAVYTRCATEPTLSSWGIPEYQTGRGCDVYKLDLQGGREERYTKVNASDATEFWPTYWKGRLGFARVYDNGPRVSYVYVKDVASSRPSERLPGGSGGTCAVRPADCTDALRPVPLRAGALRLAARVRLARPGRTRRQLRAAGRHRRHERSRRARPQQQRPDRASARLAGVRERPRVLGAPVLRRLERMHARTGAPLSIHLYGRHRRARGTLTALGDLT